jgi:hypothetical protein
MKIKNWHKFQHFKDRRPPWVKLYRDLLDDPDWHSLDPTAAKALVMIWLIASESDGEIPDIRKLSFRLRMTEKQVNQALTALSHWLDQDDIAAISAGHQADAPEGETETKRETEKEGERAPKVKSKSKGEHELPSAFTPDWPAATSQGLSMVEAHREFERFKNHAAMKNRRCSDWQAAWRNWCIKAAEYMGKPPPGDARPALLTITPADRNWNPWRSFFRDTGKHTHVKLMDKCASDGKPFTVQSEWPPGMAA